MTEFDRSDPFSRGRPWTHGDMSIPWYTHTSVPNSHSCPNGSRVPKGLYSAASNHAHGVNLLFTDGHVKLVAQSIDRSIWRFGFAESKGKCLLTLAVRFGAGDHDLAASISGSDVWLCASSYR